MAHGRAVVATAVGGLPDMVVDGETGLLVPRETGVLSAPRSTGYSPTPTCRLGANARARIEELCGWEQ